MRLLRIFLIFYFLLLINPARGKINQITRSGFLTYAQQAADDYWNHYADDIQRWSKRIDLQNVFGYSPTGNPLSCAYVSAHLYKITGDEKYAQRVRKILIDYGNLRDYYPKDFWKDRPGYENGAPALPNFFTIAFYIKAYLLLQDSNVFSAADLKIIRQNIVESCDHQMRFQEWGAMNRAVLRAEAFYAASLALPEHPRAHVWNMIAQSILQDCYGRWEIEDATLYNAVYEYALTSLIGLQQKEAYWKEAVTRYKMQYYTRLLTPYGMLPGYGDSYWNSNWHRWIPVFEKAATMYNDPEMKYAANRIANTFWDFTAEKKSIWLGTIAIDCYRWADDDIVPQEPPGKSALVLDDVIGKKIVFRDGYQDQDTYMLLNYKDEGAAGFLSREYLKLTIPVEEEKMTHGHSDENSIALLMVKGNILLHDGGYRDYMPSGVYGAYRADYFHNRIVVRKDKLFKGQKRGRARYSVKDSAAVPGQKVYDFVRNSGAYRQVRTELIDFLTTDDFDYSRTRMTDDKLKFQHDRIITWIKPLNVFVIFDAVKFLEDDYYTTVNFWHTRKILARGENYFDTQYDSLRKDAFPTDQSLLIYFPEGRQDGRMIGWDAERRYYQNEFALHQALSRWHYQGELATFTTILFPHPTGSNVQELINKIELVQVDKYPQARGVKIKDSGKTYYVCSKLDRMMDLHHRDERPQYDYEHGKVVYDEFETDGHQLMALMDENSLTYTSVYCVKMIYKNKVLFEQLPILFGLQFTDGRDRTGIGKFRYWQDTVEIK